MMTYKHHVPLWILWLTLNQFCGQINVTDDTLSFLHKQLKIREMIGSNMVNLTWEAELRPEMKELEPCYNFSFRFMDKTDGVSEMLKKNYKRIILRMHPGFIASVSKALCRNDTIVLDGNKTEFVYFSPLVYISNVSCKTYNLRSLKCTWEWRDDAPDDTNYYFALRLYSRYLPCKQYIKKNGRNTGCHVKDLLKNQKYKIKIWFSNNLTSFSKTFKTDKIEVLDPPVNISVTSMNKSIKLEWLPPPSLNELPPYCFQYQIKIIDAETEKEFKNLPIKKHDYIFSDIDRDKKYWMQIRAKQTDPCVESKYWGEWSQPVFIGKDKKLFPTWILMLVIAAGSVSLIVFLIYLCNRYVKKLCFVAIPNPSEKIKLSMFSNLDSQHCISTHNEHPVDITEIEIVTGLTDCQEENQQ